jgi:hypothetical protein
VIGELRVRQHAHSVTAGRHAADLACRLGAVLGFARAQHTYRGGSPSLG